MSLIGDAFAAVKDAIKLTDDVRKVGETLKEIAKELRDQDRRITRLEAQWDTAMQLGAKKHKPRQIT